MLLKMDILGMYIGISYCMNSRCRREEGNNIEQNNKKVRTSTLLRRLFKAPDLEGFIVKNADELQSPLFHDYIKGLCYMTKQVPERVIKHASIERTCG